MGKRALIRSTGVIGLATAISRVLGFIRDIVIASFFGTAIYAEAFVVAFRIPNLLRDLIGEGAANAAIVPVLTEELTRKGRADFFKLAQVILNILFVTLLIVTVLGMAGAPLLVKVMAPGFCSDPAKFQATVTLTRALFPFLILIGLCAYAMGVLNSLGHFAAPAFGSCFLNLAIILCAMWFGENVFGLAAGVLAGGALQLFLQIPPLYIYGWKARLTSEFTHPQANKIGILLVPRALGACVYQINVFVSTIFASLSGMAGEGAVAALYYANRVWQLPLAIFGIALAQAALPAMSRHAAMDDIHGLKDTMLFSLRALFFILIPSSVGLMVLSGPITKVLFQRGAFTAYSTGITSSALFFYSIGLVACGGIKVMVNAFYSMHDTRTPVRIAVTTVLLNILLSYFLMVPLKLGGLALGASIASSYNFMALYVSLGKKIGDLRSKALIDSLFKVLMASAVMGALIKCALIYFPISHALGLLAMIACAMAIYFAAAYLFDVRELKEVLSWITKKR